MDRAQLRRRRRLAARQTGDSRASRLGTRLVAGVLKLELGHESAGEAFRHPHDRWNIDIGDAGGLTCTQACEPPESIRAGPGAHASSSAEGGTVSAPVSSTSSRRWSARRLGIEAQWYATLTARSMGEQSFAILMCRRDVGVIFFSSSRRTASEDDNRRGRVASAAVPDTWLLEVRASSRIVPSQ
jgi:hypothetical protein